MEKVIFYCIKNISFVMYYIVQEYCILIGLLPCNPFALSVGWVFMKGERPYEGWLLSLTAQGVRCSYTADHGRIV